MVFFYISRKLERLATRLATDSNNGDDSGFLTPPSRARTFETDNSSSFSFSFSGSSDEEDDVEKGSFLGRLFHDKGHSPPQHDHGVPVLSKEEVLRRMQAISFYPLNFISEEQYLKLAWIVGTGLDLYLHQWYECYWLEKIGLGARAATAQMLTESSPMGKRFHAIYNADGDETYEGPSNGTGTNIFDILRRLHPDWGGRNSDTSFTLFGSDDHPNMDVFHKFQAFNGCFIHCPILAHWYKSLWQNVTLLPEDTEFMHVSKWARHAFNGWMLYNLIVGDKGGDHAKCAKEVMGPTCTIESVTAPHMDFEGIKMLIEEHGPLLVGVHIFDDLYDPQIVSHRGRPKSLPHKSLGHAMVVTGVRKELPDKFPEELRNECERQKGSWNAENDLKKMSTVLLIQNFWECKEFVEMDLKYITDANGELHFICGDIDYGAPQYRDTRQAAGLIRTAHCTSPVDRPNRQLLFG